jgi:hypothetical protein
LIKVEEIKNFNGFGTGKQLGEYLYSQGMNKTRFGISPGWSIPVGQTSDALTTLSDTIKFITQGLMNGQSYVVGVDGNGQIYRSSGSYSLFYKPGENTSGNGIIFDQKNRLLYPMQRYLGICDPVTTPDYTAGTATATNGSAAIVGSGTTFTAGMAGKRIRFGTETTFYTILSFTDTTHITLTANYTGTTGAGKTFTVFESCTDQWKDFGNTTTDFRQGDIYEDWVILPNVNNFAALNVTDDSFNDAAFTLPSGFKALTCRSGRNGILLGVNFNNRGIVMLWDAISSRSIAPWIWFSGTIKAIVPVEATGAWIVITSFGIYHCNGFTIEPILELLVDETLNASSILSNLRPQGATVIKQCLLFWSESGAFNRNKAGLYILNLETNTLEFVPVYNGSVSDITGGAIFFDSNFTIHLTYSTSNPAKRYITSLSNGKPPSAYLITQELGQGPNKKTALGAKLDIGIGARAAYATPDITLNVHLKIYNFKRPLWNYAQTNSASANGTTIKVDGTLFNGARVGDEITVLQGVNAGKIRHISSIANQGTNTEIWTLDSTLSSNIENTVYVSISPFQKVDKKTITSLPELRDIYFDIKNKIAGKKYLLKIVFDGMTDNTITPELHEGYFIYDDKGVL